MTIKPPRKAQVFACERSTYQEHGYTHTRFVIYRGVERTPIADQIALSAKPNTYSDQGVADRMVEHYRQLQNNGVTHVWDTYRCERVTLIFQHCNSGRFAMRVEMPDSPEALDGAIALWGTLKARLLRAMGGRAVWALQHDASPDLLQSVLDKLKCEPIAALRTQRCSLTLISPAQLPMLEQWSIV